MPVNPKSPRLSAAEAFAGHPEIEVLSSDPHWVCLRIAPKMALKQPVADFFRAFLDDLPSDLCDKLAIAVEELVGNAIEHGSANVSYSGVDLTCIRTPRLVLFQIRDAGPGFSLDSIPHAAFSNPPEDPLKHAEYRSQMGLRPGGFGILLVKQIADELVYNQSGNQVALIKYLDTPA